MNVSYNWLRQYVHHDLSPADLADQLTMAGLELEELTPIGPALDGVVVGHVLETAPHPNADKLTLCQVDLGSGDPVQIVCGAPNVATGQNVPVATVGTTLLLPDRKHPGEKVPVTLKKAKLRGEVSTGMICAEDELGLSDDHAGIMVLAADAPAGQPFADYLQAQGREVTDTVIDLNITPNRPDATSHLGVARDVAALSGTALQRPDVAIPEAGGAAAEQVTIRIEDPSGCHRYVGMIVRGVTIRESPAWLQQRLTAIGLRPRNNVVDVTNYVMHECGQPLHAFDYDQIAGQTIIVRRTADTHSFTTLDSTERPLPAGTLMICDAEREVAVAGVMGGENSEVTDDTTNILIESAYFDPSSIRKAAKALGLQTDASYRFERGVDPAGQAWAAARTAQLIAELGGGEIVPGMVDEHPMVTEPRTLDLRLARSHQLIGVEIDPDTVARLLTAIGFTVVHKADGVLRCTVPTYRPDVEREVDIIEEVARLYGYDNIPEPKSMPLPHLIPHERAEDGLQRTVRGLLAGLGLREVYTNSMLPAATATAFNAALLHGGEAGDAVVETLNPISQEMAALRPSLLPGALKVMQHNSNHGQESLRTYEFGHVFHRTGGSTPYVPGYAEHAALLLTLSGPQHGKRWQDDAPVADFFDLKGIVERLLAALRLEGVQETPIYEAAAVAAYHLRLEKGKHYLGCIAALPQALAATHDLKHPVYYAELNWDLLVKLAARKRMPTYAPISRYPVVERDLAVVVPKTQAAGPMLAKLRQVGRPLLQEVTVFDLYEGDRMGADQKSIAFAFTFGADRTLKDKEVDKRMQTALRTLEREFGATLRT